MQKAILPDGTLTELYRFAWLLAGDGVAAEEALRLALQEVEPLLEGLRSETSRRAWLARRVRQSCLQSKPPEAEAAAACPAPRLLREETLEPLEILEIEAYIVAQRFHALPEPDRTALALFYLDFLPLEEAAAVLGLSPEAFCGILGHARVKLHAGLRGLQEEALPAV